MKFVICTAVVAVGGAGVDAVVCLHPKQGCFDTVAPVHAAHHLSPMHLGRPVV